MTARRTLLLTAHACAPAGRQGILRVKFLTRRRRALPSGAYRRRCRQKVDDEKNNEARNEAAAEHDKPFLPVCTPGD